MLDAMEAMVDVARAQAKDARKAHRWARISGVAAVLAVPAGVVVGVRFGG